VTKHPTAAAEAALLEHWMSLAEVRPAVSAAIRLESALRRTRRNGIGLDRLRSAFVRLLERRGFLVGSPDDLSRSIAEIRDVGIGFDLYDLSEALAGVDAAAAECVKASKVRHLPELQPFVSGCRCGGPD
jgi:hypothetical protein